MKKLAIKLLSKLLDEQEIKGLHDICYVELIDETGRLYYKQMTSSNVKVKGLIKNDGKNLKIIMKKRKKEEICEK